MTMSAVVGVSLPTADMSQEFYYNLLHIIYLKFTIYLTINDVMFVASCEHNDVQLVYQPSYLYECSSEVFMIPHFQITFVNNSCNKFEISALNGFAYAAVNLYLFYPYTA